VREHSSGLKQARLHNRQWICHGFVVPALWWRISSSHIGDDRPEDGETAKRSFIDGTSANVDLVLSENSGNPSSRRGGRCISFTCEACHGIDDNVLELTISQHKGTTEIGWRYSPKSSDKLI
jgi:hypothetical protein